MLYRDHAAALAAMQAERDEALAGVRFALMDCECDDVPEGHVCRCWERVSANSVGLNNALAAQYGVTPPAPAPPAREGGG